MIESIKVPVTKNNQQPNASSSLNTIEYYLDDHSGSNAITSAQLKKHSKQQQTHYSNDTSYVVYASWTSTNIWTIL